jgi:hypothetical protein
MQLKRGRPPGESCGGLLLGGAAATARCAMYWMLDLHLCRENANDGGGWPPDPARFANPQPLRRGSLARFTDFIRVRRQERNPRPHDQNNAGRPRLTIVR